MAAFQPFEREAITLVARGHMSEELLNRVLSAPIATRYEYTGSGYFLTVAEPDLPLERRTLCEPPVAGVVDGVQAGFVAYIGDHELTLECHTWGEIDVPEDFRNRAVQVFAAPANFVDLRDAT